MWRIKELLTSYGFLFGWRFSRVNCVLKFSWILFISSDPTDTNDLRQIRNWVGETFCRNDPSPLSSTLTGFGYLALIHWIHRSTDRSSCRNRLDLYRCQANSTNSTNEEFQLPLLLIFPSRSPSVWHLITHPRCVTPIINNNNVLFPPL